MVLFSGHISIGETIFTYFAVFFPKFSYVPSLYAKDAYNEKVENVRRKSFPLVDKFFEHFLKVLRGKKIWKIKID